MFKSVEAFRCLSYAMTLPLFWILSDEAFFMLQESIWTRPATLYMWNPVDLAFNTVTLNKETTRNSNAEKTRSLCSCTQSTKQIHNSEIPHLVSRHSMHSEILIRCLWSESIGSEFALPHPPLWVSDFLCLSVHRVCRGSGFLPVSGPQCSSGKRSLGRSYAG